MSYDKTLGPDGWEVGPIVRSPVYQDENGDLVDQEGNEISIGGGGKVSGVAQKVVVVSEYVTVQGNAAGSPARVAYANSRRSKITITNPSDNEQDLQIGMNYADNITNPNSSFTNAVVIEPGEQETRFYDSNQWWVRQNTATPDTSGVPYQVIQEFIL
jgi:hypothetical protein